ncbi:MAG: radical SAM protein [Polyangiaceae bacterium]
MVAPRRVSLPLASEARDVNRRVRPRVAVWELTLRCNLSCGHCGSRAGKPRERELSTEECLALVEQLASLSVLEVSLIGGEAHLHPAFFPVLHALKSHGIEVGLTTGGRGIDRALAQRMADAGLDSVSVSLDGLAAAHDAQRGLEGSFEQALQAIRGVPCGFGVRVGEQPKSTGKASAIWSRCSSSSSSAARAPGKSRSPWPWVAPPTAPSGCCSRTTCSRCFRAWRL